MSQAKVEHMLLEQILYGTVRNSLGEFVLDRQSQGLSHNTVLFYRRELGYFADWLDKVGLSNLDELTADIIRKYLLDLATHRNKGGVHASYRAIKTFLLWAWDEYEKDTRNPIDRVKLPNPSNKPLPGVRVEDVQRMIDACSTELSKRDKAIFMVLLDTGVRRAELCALNVGDVDFSSGGVMVLHGKGGKSRMVYIGQKTKQVLRKYLRSRSELALHSPLFLTDEGDRLGHAGLREIIKRRALDAGLQKIPSPHDFRRCFAITSLRNGIGLAELSRLMGHSSVSVTIRYLALVDDDLAEAHRRGSPADRLRSR